MRVHFRWPAAACTHVLLLVPACGAFGCTAACTAAVSFGERWWEGGRGLQRAVYWPCRTLCLGVCDQVCHLPGVQLCTWPMSLA
jgi:hypothetical protein